MSKAGPQRRLGEQIDELKAKIALLDGDRKAYLESSSFTIQKNKDKLADLRKTNRELRKELRDRLSADDHVINQAFENRPVERAALSNKTGPDAIQTMDYKICDTIKKLNALKHTTVMKQKALDELELQYKQLCAKADEDEAYDAGESIEAQRMRDVENRLDKANLKFCEAEHIRKTYIQIKAKLQEEYLTFGNTLDDLETEIKASKVELAEVKVMHNDAIISRNAAQVELRRHEELVYAERKKREIELSKMKKEADEKMMMHEKMEKKPQRSSINGDDVGDKQALGNEEHHQKITSYEDAFKRIKDATSVSDIREVVIRFENQGDTRVHLEELKADAEIQIQKLTEEKDKLTTEYEGLKYSGEAKLSSGQRILEKYEEDLRQEEKRREELQETLDRSSAVLVQCKSGVDHLSEKLIHLKLSRAHAPQINQSANSNSDDYVLDLIAQCEEKLLKLLEELDGVDTEATLQKIQQEEFHAQVESKLPQYNTRIKLPLTQKDNVYDEDEESGEDDGQVLTRQALKKQAQQFIDQKTKKRVPKKSKKKK